MKEESFWGCFGAALVTFIIGGAIYGGYQSLTPDSCNKASAEIPEISGRCTNPSEMQKAQAKRQQDREIEQAIKSDEISDAYTAWPTEEAFSTRGGEINYFEVGDLPANGIYGYRAPKGFEAIAAEVHGTKIIVALRPR